MQEFTQKYSIVSLLENKKEGYEFPSSNWPLHVTLAGTFAIKWDVEKLIKKLDELPKQFKPISSVVSHDEYFGPEKEVHVAILDMSKELIKLHYDVVGLLKEAGAKFNNPQYIESGFRAHSTIKPHVRTNIGDTVLIKNLAVIDMFPGKDPYQRKIIKVIGLSF